MKYAIAAALLLPALAGANDAVGGVSAGGIVIRNTDAIAMKKEVLSVGHRRISVDYEFVNESGKDVEETIVFPLPAYPAYVQPYETYYGQPGDFSIEVDGKTVRFQTVVQALHKGVDVTAQLRKIGLTDAQIAYQPFETGNKVAPLSAQQRQQLGKLGLYGEDDSGDISPLWDIQVNYVWRQKFPVNKIVRVHHAYRPFVATGPGEWVMDDETAKRYCADPAFLSGWKRLAKRATPTGEILAANKVSYILKTGNTWKNGIEDFTLNIVKSKPDELVSLCFPGTFKKIDANTYQVRLRNFRPTQELEVYFGNIETSSEDYDGKMPVLRK